MIVYELYNGSSSEGLFSSLESAQTFAQEKLDGYHATWTDDTETLTTRTLVWSMQSPRPHFKETLTAVYGLENGTAFRIYEREVHE